jgi:hypothetical protein
MKLLSYPQVFVSGAKRTKVQKNKSAHKDKGECVFFPLLAKHHAMIMNLH